MSVGPELAWHDVDVGAATLTRRGAIRLPVNVQYAWRSRRRPVLYVVSSNGGPLGLVGDTHHLAAFHIDPRTGALEPFGATANLRSRPIHVSLDATEQFLLTAYNLPSAATVHRVESSGGVGAEVPQSSNLDFGITAHQILATPSNNFVILPTRGEYPEVDRAEEPGALIVFRFQDGRLANAGRHAPNAGIGYGPRHVDFLTARGLAYHVVERQNRLETFALDDAAKGLRGPLFETTTLSRPGRVVGRQMAGAVHVHPNGRFVYVSNRSLGDGGEDNIAVFAIDTETGEPRLIQNAESGGIHMRTFSIDPTGALLVAASLKSYDMSRHGGAERVPAALSVFRIGDDGRLDLARKYDVDTGRHEQFWSGMA